MTLRHSCLVLLVAVAMAAAGVSAPGADAPQAKGPTLGQWYAIGPIAVKAGEGFDTAFPPEKEINLAQTYNGLKWTPARDCQDGVVQALQPGTTGPTYLYRTISAAAPTTITGYFGSDDGLAVWLNGKQLISRNVLRGAGPNSDTAKLELQAGENKLLLKIYNARGGHGFYFSTSPQPVAGAVAAAKAANPKQAAKAAKPAAPPVQAAAFDPLADSSFESLRLAVTDLRDTYGAKYPKAAEYLARLETIRKSAGAAAAAKTAGDAKAAEALAQLAKDMEALRREALLANPLLAFDRLLLVRRAEGKLGLPQNWLGNASIPSKGYDNEIAIMSIQNAGAPLKTLYKPAGGEFAGDLELHWDGNRLLFSMPGTQNKFQVWEIKADGSGLRQVTPGDQPDVDNYDACYLPDGRIIFCSTACYLGVPCIGGGGPVGSLYVLDEKTRNIRQLTFDQDHSWCPTVLPSGRIVYTRWEYSDTPHYFSRLLFEMNPDGTAQFEMYGSNSYWPNSIFYARSVPDHPTQVAAIISGHHGVPRMGELVIFDPAKGRHEASGVVQRIPGYNRPVAPTIADGLVNNTWPKFLHPFPLSQKYFIVSCKPGPSAPWGVYLVDIFDNMVLLREERGYAMLEPTPLRATPRPPVIPDRVNPNRSDATVYLVDVYQGKGLEGVPRGAVKRLRVYTNHFAYRGMGGHINIGIDGPWDAKRILGTVPVNEDGSAMFNVPANMPIVVQPLDAEGRALQVMRSWYTAMPGEFASCVGCHEPQTSGPPPARLTIATGRKPSEIESWYGPARPFDFEREVQKPVLEKYCVGCHGGQARPDGAKIPDFRSKDAAPKTAGHFSPAYAALHPFVRRPGPESDYHLPVACEWHADTSELVQMLKKGHHGVRLDGEAWDRIYTWIDMNVPCHGTWSEYRAIAGENHQRRLALSTLYGGPTFDPEAYPAMPAVQITPIVPQEAPRPAATAVACPNWPFDGAEAQRRQAAGGPISRSIDLGGVTLELVYVPAGEFVMGGAAGCADEWPAHRVAVARPFWMARFEITNEQFRIFNPFQDSGFISVTNKDQGNRGIPANGPRQPVIRISWSEAMAFCRWLSEKTGERFSLPTEAQWEYACRAGTATATSYGDAGADFSAFANLADISVLLLVRRDSPKWIPRDDRFNDAAGISTDVGRYKPNPWGLSDMHGNVAEWTRSEYRPYPYRADDGREAETGGAARTVRGGSWYDRPQRARSSFRLSFPPWQRIYNVGFRVVGETGARAPALAQAGAE